MKPGNNKGRGESAILRAVQSLQFRIQGYSYRLIGDKLGISYEQVRNDVKNILALTLEQCKESADELRQIENERLDMLWETFYDMAINDKDLYAAQRCISISKARRELNGLDMPIKIAPTTPDGLKPYVGLEELKEEAKRRLHRLYDRKSVDGNNKGNGHASRLAT